MRLRRTGRHARHARHSGDGKGYRKASFLGQQDLRDGGCRGCLLCEPLLDSKLGDVAWVYREVRQQRHACSRCPQGRQVAATSKHCGLLCRGRCSLVKRKKPCRPRWGEQPAASFVAFGLLLILLSRRRVGIRTGSRPLERRAGYSLPQRVAQGGRRGLLAACESSTEDGGRRQLLPLMYMRPRGGCCCYRADAPRVRTRSPDRNAGGCRRRRCL